MITPETSPTLLTYCVFIFLSIGVAVYSWGKKLPGKGSWLVWAGILLVITAVGIDAGFLIKESFRTKVWMTGWVWPREERSAITVGVLQDSLSLAMTALTVAIAGIFLLNQSFLFREPHPERAHAAIAISSAGVALAWNSLTPWLVFVGIVLTILGGFVSFGSRWDSNSEASVAGKFVLQRASGFLFAFFGACILATCRSALLFNHPEVWAVSGDHLKSTWVGAILLVLGLFVQMQPFPLLGWLVSGSEMYCPLRTLLNQIYPAWAAFAILVRLAPEFAHLELFPAFGWIALASTFLIVLAGLFQKEWRQGLGIWLAAGYSLSCALLAFSGPVAAMGLFIGVSLGSLCLSCAAAALEGDCQASVTNGQRGIWIRVAAFLAASAGTGVIGFVSSTGGVRWIAQAMSSTGGEVATFLFIFFLYVLLGWKQAWKILKLNTASDAPWWTVFSLFLLVLLSLGAIWTGSVTGDVLLGVSDQIFSSGFSEFFGTGAIEIAHSADFLSASGLYWGALIFAFMTAYWTSGRKEDQWIVLGGVFPKTSKFLANGYGLDRLAERGMKGIIRLGELTEHLFDYKIWNSWVPQGLSLGIRALTEPMSRIDAKLSIAIGSTLRKIIEVPAKILQLIQTGDVRWYLFFALSSGFALLSHFLNLKM